MTKTLLIKKGTIINAFNGAEFGKPHAQLIEGEKEIVLEKDIKGEAKIVREILKNLFDAKYGTPKNTFWFINTYLSQYQIIEY